MSRPENEVVSLMINAILDKLWQVNHLTPYSDITEHIQWRLIKYVYDWANIAGSEGQLSW